MTPRSPGLISRRPCGSGSWSRTEWPPRRSRFFRLGWRRWRCSRRPDSRSEAKHRGRDGHPERSPVDACVIGIERFAIIAERNFPCERSSARCSIGLNDSAGPLLAEADAEHDRHRRGRRRRAPARWGRAAARFADCFLSRFSCDRDAMSRVPADPGFAHDYEFFACAAHHVLLVDVHAFAGAVADAPDGGYALVDAFFDGHFHARAGSAAGGSAGHISSFRGGRRSGWSRLCDSCGRDRAARFQILLWRRRS